MNENIIPEHLRQFIFLNINSIAELECLLIFHSRPGWCANETTIAAQLYITEKETALILKHFADRGFLKRSEDKNQLYCYEPSSASSDIIQELTEFYAKYLVPVTNLIHSKSRNEVQKFADAFWIRKD